MSGRSRARRILGWSAALLGLSFVVLTVTIVRLPSLRAARIDYTRCRIKMLERAMEVYRSKSGHYPPSLKDLGFVDGELRDAWDNPFVFELVDRRPVITSLGSDGRPGGEGDAADLSSLRNDSHC